jgi:hypothetical protein
MNRLKTFLKKVFEISPFIALVSMTPVVILESIECAVVFDEFSNTKVIN